MSPATRPVPSPGGTTTAPAPATPDGGHTTGGDGGTAPASWWRRAAVVALPLGALTYVGVNDPSAAGGIYPACPSRSLLGFDCPGCGGLRGTHALLHGDLPAALDHNVLLPFLLLLCAYAAALVVAPLFGHRIRVVRPPGWAAVALTGALVAFTVLRNLPVGGLEWLASGASGAS